MSSFFRYAGAAALILSFGLFVQALPVLADVKIPVPSGTDVVSKALSNLVVDGKLEAKLKALCAIKTLVELKACLAIIVALLKGCADELSKIGAGIIVDVEAQASIVACVYAIITLLVKVCLQISVKFSITAVAALFAEIDVCVRLLLVNLDICVVGILALIVKACVSITLPILDSLKFDACVALLASVGLN
ncbi:unnamed protein product [Rhizoctonia solani]|uniref:Transmembrane protein n=1 Tax=Rhizoctonia solani TaxID=456999 RepID=A0A8H3GE19_9AGAM|nr:unnamed protein product [Rhizoctonia solani]